MVYKVQLNILHWNARSIVPKKNDLEQLLILDKIHIVALSETWLSSSNQFFIKDYNTFRKDRIDSYGGVAILTHKSIKAQLVSSVNLNTGIELIHVRIFNCNFLHNVISIYCPPNIRTTQNDWDAVFSLVRTKTLIIGDFNGHHSNWSTKTDQRGIQIFDSTIEHGYYVLNNGDPTRLKLVNGVLQKTAPDISIVSSDISLFFDWRVTNESLGSDHLIVKLSTSFTSTSQCKKKRNFKKADWSTYSESIKDALAGSTLPANPQEAYDDFLKIINSAADVSIPLLKFSQNPSNKFLPKPYWSQDLSKAVAERRLALTNFRKNPTPINLENLQNKTRLAQKLVRNAKSKGFREFCSSIDEVTSSRDMWRRMRWLKGYRSPRINVDKSMANSLLNNLTPDFTCPMEPTFTSDNPKLEAQLSMHEFEKALKSKDTAPGADDISFSMIKYLPDVAKQVLVKIYNTCLFSNFVPTQWRQISIVPIPKPGRDITTATSIRPISLMSCLCKILHSIINRRMEWYIENRCLFAEETIGFRKARSCYDNLNSIITAIQTGFSKKLMTIGCFIDIDNAYNNVDITSLLGTLDQLGVGAHFCRYLWEFLKERYLTIDGSDYNISRIARRGLAQGDPLSPLLFNIATINVCKTIASSSLRLSQYADDFVVFISSNNINQAAVQIQNALDTMCNLFNDLNLDISHSKSKICIFSKGYKRQSVNVTINSKRLDVVDCVKYLGMWLDRSLRWGKHINETSEKVLKFLNIFKVLAGSNWGVHPKYLRQLYISILRSRIDYGSIFYDNSAKCHLFKLDKIQNQAMRIIGSFIKTTPIHSMESELCLQPLYLRRRFLAGKYWLKMKSIETNTSISFIGELSNSSNTSPYWHNKRKPVLVSVHDELNSLDIHCSKQLEMFSLDTWPSNIDVSGVIKHEVDFKKQPKRHYHPLSLKNMFSDFINTVYSDFIGVYTDGSKDEFGLGAAFYDSYHNCSVKFQINGNMCIMEGELIAIAEALSYIESTDHPNIVIFTDSKSSLQHLARCTSTFRGTSTAYTILRIILNLQSQGRNVVLQWIPSHVGIRGNEIADFSAKEAITDGIPTNIHPFYTNYIHKIKVDCHNLWKEYFNVRSREIGIWYKTIQPHPLSSPWIDNNILNRRETVIALRLRSGHIPRNKFLHLMKKSTTPNCLLCNSIDDVYHILMECVCNEAFRNSILSFSYRDIGHCNSVLAEPVSDAARTLYKLVMLGN